VYLPVGIGLIASRIAIRIGYYLILTWIWELLAFFKGGILREEGPYKLSFGEKVELMVNYARIPFVINTFILLFTVIIAFISPMTVYETEPKSDVLLVFTVVSSFFMAFAAYRYFSIYAQVTATRRDENRYQGKDYAWKKSQIFLDSLGLLVIAVFLGFMLGQCADAIQDFQKNPAIGNLHYVSSCNCKMHIFCTLPQGLNDYSNLPTVVYLHGLKGSSLDAERIRAVINNNARFCSYDRPGYGWSEATRAYPRDAEQHTDEFLEILRMEGIKGDVILLAHSYAGLFLPNIYRRCNSSLSQSTPKIKSIFMMDVVSIPDRSLEKFADPEQIIKYGLYVAPLAFPRIGFKTKLLTDLDLIYRLPGNIPELFLQFICTMKYFQSVYDEERYFLIAAKQSADILSSYGYGSLPIYIFPAIRGFNFQRLNKTSTNAHLYPLDSDHFIPISTIPASNVSLILLNYLTNNNN
jgi:pimeloyl-ACP methyl ester carboxylesterase